MIVASEIAQVTTFASIAVGLHGAILSLSRVMTQMHVHIPHVVLTLVRVALK